MEEEKQESFVDRRKSRRIDLLGFQKNLNEQFMEIFELKKRGSQIDFTEATDHLGLITSHEDILFFIPLKNLKSIAMSNKLESIVSTKSWLAGFNQEHGDVFSIFSFKKSLNLIVKNESDTKKQNTGMDSKIVYLKDLEGLKIGLVLENLKLEYTAEFTKIINTESNGLNTSWEFADDVDFDVFAKRENMGDKEWELLSAVKANVVKKKNVLNGDYSSVSNGYELMSLMIKDVYLDMYGKKPIFVLSLDNFAKYFKNIMPY